eukprot:EC790290.1.p4 GENE.EC790290.1~~EC790290.1.p4  ORF type:complete len:54 (+),score=0.75 EC790290.1:378-539(+)
MINMPCKRSKCLMEIFSLMNQISRCKTNDLSTSEIQRRRAITRAIQAVRLQLQ